MPSAALSMVVDPVSDSKSDAFEEEEDLLEVYFPLLEVLRSRWVREVLRLTWVHAPPSSSPSAPRLEVSIGSSDEKFAAPNGPGLGVLDIEMRSSSAEAERSIVRFPQIGSPKRKHLRAVEGLGGRECAITGGGAGMMGSVVIVHSSCLVGVSVRAVFEVDQTRG
ncbi:hypothetical protein B0H17DRAFT_1134340 [Mycena rosella]|uniref:Uncharacterized protein n=1 Tax=Mycena rosella TaxID=1033263 RepID=A0AAD7DFS3_MYCRO|nr:hypothetical protein B0H17DRAFT_1134340 [Mycena rosella]